VLPVRNGGLQALEALAACFVPISAANMLVRRESDM
jgi:hypothetical protein